MSTQTVEAAETAAPEAKALRKYELMLTLNPDLLESKLKAKLGDFEDAITKNGGKIFSQDLWGKRLLAYRIGKFKEGIYAVYDFEITPDFIKELNEQARIDVDVMRHILISVPEGYVYTKYKEEAQAMEEERPRKRKMSSHTYPGASSVAPAPVAKIAPAVEAGPAPESQPVDEAALEKKLDEILGDSDLKI